MTKILLVEDDKNLREIYGTRLKAEGYTIVSAGDGEEALAMAIKERPDLIISDVMMPKISGFDMLDILRSTTETKNIHVIMMTALSSEDQRQRGESLGADRYLVKSQVGIEDVVHTVHDVLADGSAPVAVAPTPVMSVTPVSPPPSASAPIVAPPVPVATVPAPTPLAIPPREPASVAAVPVAQPVQSASATPIAPVASPQQPTATPYQTLTIPNTPTPVAPVASVAPVESTFTPESVQLPQPTAPFSTPRPLGLGDRIIQPLPSEENPSDTSIAERIEAALGTLPTPATAPSVAPIPQPVPPTPPAPVAPVPVAPSVPPTAPSGLEASAPTPGLAFEETPRPPTPPQSIV